MVAERAYEYAGLIMGSGSAYGVRNVEGLYDANMRSSESPKTQDHGAYISARLLEAKRIIIEGHFNSKDAATFAERASALRAAFQPKEAIAALNFRLPGESERLVYCIPKRRHIPISMDYVQDGLASWVVELIAGDPRVYDLVEGGLIGSGTATNEGDFPTEPVFTIQGPSTNPRIENTTTGEAIQVNVAVPSGQSLVLNVTEKTAKLEGVSVYGDIATPFSWFDFEPGDNVIAFTGGGTLDTRWRSAWV